MTLTKFCGVKINKNKKNESVSRLNKSAVQDRKNEINRLHNWQQNVNLHTIVEAW